MRAFWKLDGDEIARIIHSETVLYSTLLYFLYGVDKIENVKDTSGSKQMIFQ